MEQKFNFLEFLKNENFIEAKSNEENYTLEKKIRDHYIGFKINSNKEYEITSGLDNVIFEGEIPKTLEEAKQLIESVYKINIP